MDSDCHRALSSGWECRGEKDRLEQHRIANVAVEFLYFALEVLSVLRRKLLGKLVLCLTESQALKQALKYKQVVLIEILNAQDIRLVGPSGSHARQFFHPFSDGIDRVLFREPLPHKIENL